MAGIQGLVGVASINGRANEAARLLGSVSLRSLQTSASAWQAEPAPKKAVDQAAEAKPSPSSKPAAPQGSTASASTSASSSAAPGASGPAAGAPGAEELGKKIFEGVKSGYEQARSKFGQAAGGASGSGSSGAPGGGASSDNSGASRAKQFLQAVGKEVRATFQSAPSIPSLTQAYDGPRAAPGAGLGAQGASDLMLVQERKSAWQRAWSAVRDRLGGSSNPVLQRLEKLNLRDNPVYKRGAGLAEDLKERWETSDHPVVHKMEDLKSAVLAVPDAAQAMQEIRSRHPDFDMLQFQLALKADAPIVTRAVLTHDLATLKQHCGPELLERFAGIFGHYEREGLLEDPNILYHSDVEVVEISSLEGDPFITVAFNCQQLKCTRDRFGNVVEGSPDSIQRVMYMWGLQQEPAGVVTAAGQARPPRWVIRQMVWSCVQALV